MKSPQTPRNAKYLVPFLIAQALIVSVAVAGVGYRSWQLRERSALPPLREAPLEVAPQYNLEIINDAELVRVLRKIRPQFHGKETSVGHVEHNLRCWGTEAEFGEPQFSSGEAMRRLLLDNRNFMELYGDKKAALLINTPEGGVRIRDFEGPASSPHDDHLVASLGEVGTPLAYPVITPQGGKTFRDIVEQSLRDFRLNQTEYEWSALTYALYVKANRWMTSEGQEVDFNMLADRIMRQEMPQGVCMGNHRLHALVMLIRVNDEWDGPEPMLSPAMRQRVIEYLQQQTAKLVRNQHSDGFWNNDWPTKTPESKLPTAEVGDRLGDRLIATGHALEWWALAPQEVLPPRDVLNRAAQWVVRTVDELSPQQVKDNETFLSHAGRALALWRGKYPHEIDISAAEKKPPAASPMKPTSPQGEGELR